MKNDTFVVEAGDLPVVFSPSPDSPAAPYLVEHQPESIDEMYRLGIIHESVKPEHLEQAATISRRVSLSDAVIMDERGRWISDQEIPGVVTVNRNAAILEQSIDAAARHLGDLGYEPWMARLTAQKASAFLNPAGTHKPIWRMVELGDLEVRGILYVSRQIGGLRARNAFFGWTGWIVPEGNYFLMHCEKIYGEPRPHIVAPLNVQVWRQMAGIGPPGPIEGWTDRVPVNEIRERAAQVTREWQ